MNNIKVYSIAWEARDACEGALSTFRDRSKSERRIHANIRALQKTIEKLNKLMEDCKNAPD